MCSVIPLIFSALLCPLALLIFGVGLPLGAVATVEPPPVVVTVAPVTAASIEISTDATSVQVGDTLTITGIPVNIGLPYYTLALSSGVRVTVTYSNEVRESVSDPQFEIVSAVGEMNRVTFVLRALAPGTVRAFIGSTGEVRTPEGVFSWGAGMSDELELVVESGTPVVGDVPAPTVEISVDTTEIKFGDTVTITAVPVNIGQPQYVLELSSGLTAIVTYENEVLMTGFDSNFRVLSMTADMKQATFVLRALARGTVEVTVSAAGEVQSPDGAYTYDGAISEPVELVISI